jgi:hypothetical protein
MNRHMYTLFRLDATVAGEISAWFKWVILSKQLLSSTTWLQATLSGHKNIYTIYQNI